MIERNPKKVESEYQTFFFLSCLRLARFSPRDVVFEFLSFFFFFFFLSRTQEEEEEDRVRAREKGMERQEQSPDPRQ